MKIQVLAAYFLPATALVAGAQTVAETEDAFVQAEFVEVPAVEPKGAARIKATLTPVTGFWAKLSTEERAAAGLEKLSAEQRTALEGLIEKEIKLALQGDVRGFAGTFISRRTEQERTAAGLGVLTTGEKYQLDRLVSRALAATPPQPPVLITRPPTSADVTNRQSDWETHGLVQLEYGWGSGDREYKAGTVAVTQVNPKTGTAFSFAYTAVEGDGLWYCRDYSRGWRGRPFGMWSY